MDIQDLISGMSSRMQKIRATRQMTLGKMIETLEAMSPNDIIDGIGHPHSYRGYYEDLAFERSPNNASVALTLEMCRAVMGKVFKGYKGGDFMMGALTPVWIAEYGSTGERIIAIREDGTIEAAAEDVDD